MDARTIAAGDLAGGNWRLAAGPTDRGPFLVFEERAEPGAAWVSAGIASPERADCLASYVIEAGVLGGQHYVAAWATPEVGKVTVRATPASAVQILPFHAVPGSSRRLAGRLPPRFQHGHLLRPGRCGHHGVLEGAVPAIPLSRPVQTP